jgi:lipoyl(octanoyl) transferase
LNFIKNHSVYFQHLGLIDYQKAWDYQEQLFSWIIDQKLKNKDLKFEDQKMIDNYLLFCQHNHVYTLGKSGDRGNLLIDNVTLQEKKATFYHINRGGDITYHGPGQIVGYPIIDLDNFVSDIHKYLRLIEESIILTLKDYGLDGGRIEGLTGVWLDYKEKKNPRKICAIGVKTSRWVTMHGFALNVSTNLKYFDYIVPCGIDDKAVTSLRKELGEDIELVEVEKKVKYYLGEVFNMRFIDRAPGI